MVAEQATSKCPRIYIVIDIIAPSQVYVPPLGGVEHPLAPEFMAAMRQHGNGPFNLWRVVNALADARNPDSRPRRRCWRLRYLCALRELLRAGVLFRHGPLVAASNFATRPRPRSPRRLPPAVAVATSRTPGSSLVAVVPKREADRPEALQDELVAARLSLLSPAPETKSAPPTPAEIAEAARKLAQLPRKKRWSGWLHSERMWRLREVVVPGGQVLPAAFVRRNWVYTLLPDTPEFEDRVFERYRAEDVEIYRSPEAALLGRLPPRAGRRPRGRPRTSSE